MRIALATCDGLPSLTADDQRLSSALHDLGVEVAATVWSDDRVRWTTYDAVVVRSCWDYHLRPDAFLGWVDSLASANVALFNAPRLIRWNAHKGYLLGLQRAGIAIPPSLWVNQGDANAAVAVNAFGFDTVVVKPAVSASAHDTFVTSLPLAEDSRDRLASLVTRGDVLVQVYLQDITNIGETSFVFIGGQLSHAVLKRPAPGDFRVHEEYGGHTVLVQPPSFHVREAEGVLAQLPDAPLFARIDAIAAPDRFVLMEVELIEPELFLRFNAAAAARLASAVVRRVALV